MNTERLGIFALPELSSQKDPPFTTRETCTAWIAALAITNAPQAQLRLRYALEAFNRYALPDDPAAGLRLEILEQLRAPILFVQHECLKRFTKQRVAWPLAEAEKTAFNAAQTLWHALETGYLQVLRLLLRRASGLSLSEDEHNTAARATRCALTSARAVYLDHLHAGMLPDVTFWHRLHHTFMVAEHLEVTTRIVGDKSPAIAVYVDVLLLGMAQPDRLSSQQIEQVSYWAQRWAPRVPLLHQRPEDTRTPSIEVDLSSGQPPAYARVPSKPTALTQGRWLDLRALRKTIKQRLVKLREGVSPQELHLGPHCRQPDGEELLQQVYRDWCKGGDSRATARGNLATTCVFVTGIEAIHHHLGGQRIPIDPSTQASSTSPYRSRRAHEEIATFGHVIQRAIEKAAPEPDYPLEQGQVLDETLHEILLQRPLDASGPPLRPHQLVGVRLIHAQEAPQKTTDGTPALQQLAHIHWIVADLGTNSLRVGLHLFPGMPQAVHLVPAAPPESKGLSQRPAQGFCLPAIPLLHQPATVLIPPRWFDITQTLTIQHKDDTIPRSNIQLTQRFECDLDFERCAYEPMK